MFSKHFVKPQTIFTKYSKTKNCPKKTFNKLKTPSKTSQTPQTTRNLSFQDANKQNFCPITLSDGYRKKVLDQIPQLEILGRVFFYVLTFKVFSSFSFLLKIFKNHENVLIKILYQINKVKKSKTDSQRKKTEFLEFEIESDDEIDVPSGGFGKLYFF